MDALHEPSGAGDNRRRIGEVFVELGFITSSQLDDALEVQRRTGERIGEILVKRGSITRFDLASALTEHWDPDAAKSGSSRPISLAGMRSGERDVSPTVGGSAAEQVCARCEQLEQRLAHVEQSLAELAGLREADLLALGARLYALEARGVSRLA